MRNFLFFKGDFIHRIILSKLLKLSRNIIMMLILFVSLIFLFVVILPVLSFRLHILLSCLKWIVIYSVFAIIIVWRILILLPFATFDRWFSIVSIIVVLRYLIKIIFLILTICLNIVCSGLSLFLLLSSWFRLRRNRLFCNSSRRAFHFTLIRLRLIISLIINVSMVFVSQPCLQKPSRTHFISHCVLYYTWDRHHLPLIWLAVRHL